MLITEAYLSVQKGESKNMVEAMGKIKKHESGFSGTFEILENGNITNDIAIYMMNNGNLIPVSE